MTGSRRARAVTVVLAVALAALLTACARSPVDGGEPSLDESGEPTLDESGEPTLDDAGDTRVEEVRRAREALAGPVPALVAASSRFRDEIEQVWTTSAASERRADLAGQVDGEAVLAAAASLAAVDLTGDGPDVAAARTAVDAVVDAAEDLVDAGARELTELDELAAADERLRALPPRWDEPGSFSEQLGRLEELEVEARELAVDLDREPALPCAEAWRRRVDAAVAVADAAADLHGLVERRDGEGFDLARAAYGRDPFGTGDESLGELDAGAADGCWERDSAVAAARERMAAAVDELESALDPRDLVDPSG